MKGILRDGLYHLEEAIVKPSVVPVRLTAACESKMAVNINKSKMVVSKTTWHRWLGHPSLRIFDLVARGCNLLSNKGATEFFSLMSVG